MTSRFFFVIFAILFLQLLQNYFINKHKNLIASFVKEIISECDLTSIEMLQKSLNCPDNCKIQKFERSFGIDIVHAFHTHLAFSYINGEFNPSKEECKKWHSYNALPRYFCGELYNYLSNRRTTQIIPHKLTEEDEILYEIVIMKLLYTISASHSNEWSIPGNYNWSRSAEWTKGKIMDLQKRLEKLHAL